MKRLLPGPLRRLRSLNVVVALIGVAATALAYYSYRYTRDLASRGEKSILDTNRDLAEGLIKRIEQIIVDSDQTLFELVDLQNLRELPRRWGEVVRLSPAIESAIILDERYEMVPDGFHSKKRSKAEVDAFRELFLRRMLPALDLRRLKVDEHKHLHGTFDGRSYLLSCTRRRVDGRDFYIVLEADLAYLVGEVFPESFSGIDARRVYQVVDEEGNLVFGHPFSGIPEKYVVTLRFSKTLYGWRLKMAPREAPSLHRQESTRRLFDLVLIVLAAATVFVGLVILTMAVRAERRANRLKSEFIANVSHELKTPLSLIRMFGELLATGRSQGAEKTEEYAAIVMRESERLTHLIDNVLDFARLERGKVAYDFQVGDVAEVLSRGADVFRYRLEREGIDLKVDIEPGLPPARIDENAMTLLLLNLVDNAIKYAGDGKEIRVSLERAGDRLFLRVADRGPGIPRDERERIFERFYRARSVRGLQTRGSGIGLSLVQHIAEAHGGTVRVDPRTGGGSVFTVSIPVWEDGASSEEEPSAA